MFNGDVKHNEVRDFSRKAGKMLLCYEARDDEIEHQRRMEQVGRLNMLISQS